MNSPFFHVNMLKRYQGLRNVWVSVRPSVHPSVRPIIQLQQRATGLLLSAVRAGDVNR